MGDTPEEFVATSSPRPLRTAHPLSEGDLVKITVIPEWMSGDWRVDFQRK